MNKISGKSLAIFGSVVLISGGLYASREWWSPWAEVGPSTSVVPDPAARIMGASGPDIPAASAPTAANALVLRSRYELQGVMGGAGADASGLALIAVDGSLARTVHVGEAVGDGLVLLGLGAGNARLGLPGGPPVLVLEVGVPAASAGGPQPAGQNAPAGSAGGPIAGSPAAAVAYGANGAPLSGSVMTQALPVMTQALPVVAADRAAVNRRPAQDLAHPGRHQRLQSVKTAP
jgi:hypothetical protein